MFAIHFAGGGGRSPVLTLDSGQTIFQETGGGGNANARVKVDNDGNVYKSEDTGTPSWTQIGTATNWIRPTNRSPGDYEVRYTSLTGDALDAATTAENTWHPMSSGDWTLVQTQSGTGTDSSTFTVEIRKGSSGAAAVSDSFTLTATVTSE